MRRVSRLRAALIFVPILSILAAPTAFGADATSRFRLPKQVKRIVIAIMGELGIPPGK